MYFFLFTTSFFVDRPNFYLKSVLYIVDDIKFPPPTIVKAEVGLIGSLIGGEPQLT